MFMECEMQKYFELISSAPFSPKKSGYLLYEFNTLGGGRGGAIAKVVSRWQNYNFASGIVWVRNLVSNIKGGT
jgi:hypothetical protein